MGGESAQERPLPRPKSAVRGEGMRAQRTSWPIPEFSLVLRPWIQDIEGANAKDLCSVSSVVSLSFEPTGEVSPQKVEERGGDKSSWKAPPGTDVVNAFPHILTLYPCKQVPRKT